MKIIWMAGRVTEKVANMEGTVGKEGSEEREKEEIAAYTSAWFQLLVSDSAEGSMFYLH